MKKQFNFNLILIIIISLAMSSCGSTVKVNGISKLRVIEVEREFPFPIEKVWDALYVGFGEGYKFNPHWVKTSWVGDIQEAKVGAVRVMQNDEKGKQILHERILDLNKEERSLRFEIFKAKGEFEDMTIGMEHFMSTGEIVTKEKFDSIEELYK